MVARRGANLQLFGGRSRMQKVKASRARSTYLFLLGICAFAIFSQLGFMLAVNFGYSKVGLVVSGMAGFGIGLGYDSMGAFSHKRTLRGSSVGSFAAKDGRVMDYYNPQLSSDNNELAAAQNVHDYESDLGDELNSISVGEAIQESTAEDITPENEEVAASDEEMAHSSDMEESETINDDPDPELVDQELNLPSDSIWPKPDGWELYGFSNIRRHFKCKAYAHDQTKPLPTNEDWELFRSKFKEIVDVSATFDDPVPPTNGYTLGDGGPPPYYAKHSADGRGRGLFASRDIKKGELTHDGTTSDIMFPDGMSWRRYIFALPRNKACDMVDWTWTQQTEEDGKFRIFSATNISVLHNTAVEDANVNPPSSTSSKFYALRDIKKDEELLTDYSWYDTDWDAVDLATHYD